MEIIDFSGTFTFFEKLRLYQTYVKKGGLFEKTKRGYWLFGKAILYWAFSENHLQIAKPISANFIAGNKEIGEQIVKIAKDISKNEEYTTWVEENISSKTIIIHVLAYLQILGFMKEVSQYSEEDLKKENIQEDLVHAPQEMYVTNKGYALGELLHKIYCGSFLERQLYLFQLQWVTRLFYTLLIILILTTILVFIDNLKNVGILAFLAQFFKQ